MSLIFSCNTVPCKLVTRCPKKYISDNKQNIFMSRYCYSRFKCNHSTLLITHQAIGLTNNHFKLPFLLWFKIICTPARKNPSPSLPSFYTNYKLIIIQFRDPFLFIIAIISDNRSHNQFSCFKVTRKFHLHTALF